MRFDAPKDPKAREAFFLKLAENAERAGHTAVAERYLAMAIGNE